MHSTPSTSMLRTGLLSVCALALGSAAHAQSFNVDVGVGFSSPSNAYGAAAAQPGVWNEVDMTTAVFTPIPLTEAGGAASGVTIEFNKQGNGNYSFDNVLTTGDDEALMDDVCDVGNGPLDKVKFTFLGLTDGDIYDVYAYAWAPDVPLTYFTDIEVVGGVAGIQNCGGNDWTGAHVLGETFVKDTVVVANGGIAIKYTQSGGFAGCNGLQLVKAGGTGCAPATTYCTAGTSASGCQATLSSAGTASATATSGFTVTAMNVEGNKDGLFFVGTNGQQANSWGNGTSFQCVVPPVKRFGLLPTNGSNGSCDGVKSQDMNAYWAGFPAKNPGAGAVTQAQLWYRDPLNTSNQTTSLSNAIEFTVCP